MKKIAIRLALWILRRTGSVCPVNVGLENCLYFRGTIYKITSYAEHKELYEKNTLTIVAEDILDTFGAISRMKLRTEEKDHE